MRAMGAGRMPALDGLRGIAVLAVMALHFRLYGFGDPGAPLWEQVYAAATGLGWAGVDLFFVLSGFLITGILYDSREDHYYYRVFYGRRTVRIFPLYYATLTMLFLVIPFALKMLHQQHRATLAQLASASQFFSWTYLMNWPMAWHGFDAAPEVMQHFWSLCVEEQFYLLWPLAVRSLPRRRLMFLCGGLALSALLLRIALHAMAMPAAAYVWTFCRMDALAIGALLALALRDGEDWSLVKRYRGAITAGGLAALVTLAAMRRTTSSGDPGMDTAGILLLAVVFGGLVAFAADAPAEAAPRLMSRVLTAPVLRFFGKYSYGLYVFHQPLMVTLGSCGVTTDRLERLLPGKAAALVAVNGIALTLSTGLALASWHLLEKHFLKLKDHPWLAYGNRGSGAAAGERPQLILLKAKRA